MALEDLSITFDDAKKVFGVCMAIGSFMAAGFVWISKIDTSQSDHKEVYEPMVKDTAKIAIDNTKTGAVHESRLDYLESQKKAKNVTGTGFVWDD